MKSLLKYTAILAAFLITFNACQKEQYELGELITPSNVDLTYTLVGADDANPAGDGSGVVNFVATASDNINFTYLFGDGKDNAISPDGKTSHQFSVTGINSYNVTVIANGTGGFTASKTITIDVFSSFSDDEALEFLTGGSSKTWYWASDVPAHAGMGPISDDYGSLDFSWPNWWSIGTWDSDKSCMYEAEFVFTKTDNGLTFEQTQGPAFIPGTYAGTIGVAGDQCHGDDVVPSLYGVKNVSFAPSSSKAALEGVINGESYRGTSMSFSDGGFMCWYVGSSTYDIIKVTENTLHVRIEEAGSAAWYHIFTSEKPVQ